MVGAFLYLTVCSLRNRMRRRLQRLREPRYLVGLAAGLGYLYLVFFRRSVRRSALAGGSSGLSLLAVPIQIFGSVFLLAAAAVAWVLPGIGQPIAFTRAEVQFLFQAPVTRRDLLHYKLLRSQIGIVFSSVIFALFMRPSSLEHGWMITVGLWLLLAVVGLHFTGVALRRSSLAEHGASGIGRQWLPLAVVVVAVGIIGEALVRNWAMLAEALGSGESFIAEVQRVATSGAAGAVLWPFRALVRLPLASTPAEFWQALPPVLAMLALNYAWVIRSDAAFEEASAAQAEKRAVQKTSRKPVARGSTSTPFRLSLDGPPETAILWKNLILLGRYVSVRTLVRLLPILVVLVLAARGEGRSSSGLAIFIAAMCLPLGAMMLLMGPQMMRNDLRQDLEHLALLKTWPVRSAALIRGEVLAPTIVMSIIVWLLILTGALLSNTATTGTGLAALVLDNKWSFVAAAALVTPAILLSQTVLLNGLAVVLPAWSVTGASRARGIAAMGQRMLMLAGILLTLALSLVPGAVVAAVVAFAIYYATGAILIIVPALLLALFVVAECWLVVEALGRALDRTDVTAIDATE
jgi:ABC-2 type transport system permease protein